MNLFASPLTPSEFLAATMVMSLFKVTAVSVVMSLCAWVFYGYNVLSSACGSCRSLRISC